MRVVSFVKKNSRGILLLLLIIFIALAISLLCPFYMGVQEGLTAAELDTSAPIKTALLTYTNAVEKNCQKAISSISSLSGLAQTDSIALSPIVANANFTNSAKFNQIVALNSSTPGLLDLITEVQGQNFTALLKLLKAIPKRTSDDSFNRIVTQQLTAVNRFINNTDMQSPYYSINTYIQNTISSG